MSNGKSDTGGSPHTHGLGVSDTKGHTAGRKDSGPSFDPSQEGSNGGRHTEGTQTVRNHLRRGPGERVYTPREIEALRLRLVQGFEEGDPEQAWSAAQELLELSKSLVVEAAKQRFKTTFGTSRCESCTGLRVTDGVLATCFQLKQCYYKGFSAEDLTERQLRVLK